MVVGNSWFGRRARGWVHDGPTEEHEIEELEILRDQESEMDVTFQLPGVMAKKRGFESLDGVNLVEEFDERACFMKTVPRFSKGPYRIALRRASEEINVEDLGRQERGWKLFLLFPWLFLHHGPRSSTSRSCGVDLRSSIRDGSLGREKVTQEAAQARRRRNRTIEDDLTRRVSRAVALVQIAEVASTRQALEGASLAHSLQSTWISGCSSEMCDQRKEVQQVGLLHLQVLLDVPRDARAFFRACEKLCRAQVPVPIRDAEKVQAATAPFQCAMATKSGCEWVDGDGPGDRDVHRRHQRLRFDFEAGHAQGLMDLDVGSSTFLFVALFYGTPSGHLWEDSCGRTHTIVQGEDSEEGDATMPLFFSLGQHSALPAVQAQMADGEVLLEKFCWLSTMLHAPPRCRTGWRGSYTTIVEQSR